METRKKVYLKNIIIGNELPFVLIGGLNVLESEGLAIDVAGHFASVCKELKIPYIFKGSYDKANRSSGSSYRGPGLEKGLEILKKIKEIYDIPVLTDVHTEEQAKAASKICDVIQLPAFLARQTDLIKSMSNTDCVINIKKPQFISPSQVTNIVDKFLSYKKDQILICERGTNFGYDNLVVDMLGVGKMKEECNNTPIIFDVTHSLQFRNSSDDVSNGRRAQVLELARAGISIGIAGLFLEAHPHPGKALCDGPSALPLNLLRPFLQQIKELDDLIKKLPKLEIE